jgi:excisionase family DNA binding protein
MMSAGPSAPANDLSPAVTNGTLPAAAAPAPEYLTTVEAAALLGVSVEGLEALRARGEAPPFVRAGHAVRYRRDDLRTTK